MSQEPATPTLRNTVCGLATACVSALLAMLAVFLLVTQLSYKDWVPATATVESTGMQSRRSGQLVWSVTVSFAYEVDGRRYQKSNWYVRDDPDPEVTKSEQKNWPAGKQFIIYHERRDPESASRYQDGQVEALAVVLSLASGICTLLAGVLVLAYQGRKRKPVSSGKRANGSND